MRYKLTNIYHPASGLRAASQMPKHPPDIRRISQMLKHPPSQNEAKKWKRKSGLNVLHKARILKKMIALEPWRPGGPEIEASRAVRGLRNLEKVKKE